MADHRTSAGPESSGDVLLEEELREPPEYAVYLHNDDYTSMTFVVMVLKEIFHRSEDEATAIMLSVHRGGKGKCGVYTKEIAETKVHQVKKRAQSAGYPLKCTMEQE